VIPLSGPGVVGCVSADGDEADEDVGGRGRSEFFSEPFWLRLVGSGIEARVHLDAPPVLTLALPSSHKLRDGVLTCAFVCSRERTTRRQPINLKPI